MVDSTKQQLHMVGHTTKVMEVQAKMSICSSVMLHDLVFLASYENVFILLLFVLLVCCYSIMIVVILYLRRNYTQSSPALHFPLRIY